MEITMLKDHYVALDGVNAVLLAANSKQDVNAELAEKWIANGTAAPDHERLTGGPSRQSTTPADSGQNLNPPQTQALAGAPEKKAALSKTSTNDELTAALADRGVTVPDGAKKADLLKLAGLDGDAAELRDESTVEELTHEAERRGITAPSGALKADLQKLVGYTPSEPAAA